VCAGRSVGIVRRTTRHGDREEAAQLQASLNLENGPLVRVALFYCGFHKSARLLMVIHHLVVDSVSWRIR